MSQELTSSPPAPVHQTLGHINLNYRAPEDGPCAARLFELLGFRRHLGFPLPDGSWFYQYYVEGTGPAGGDGIIYLSPLPEANRALLGTIREILKIGHPNEHPDVAAVRRTQEADPESQFHVGLLLDSLETLEERVLLLRRLAETDPDFKGRIKTTLNRARLGDTEIDRRMDRSPIYKDVTRYTYGRGGVQAFVETDLLTVGPLGGAFTIELDYIFPGREKHMLNCVEL